MQEAGEADTHQSEPAGSRAVYLVPVHLQVYGDVGSQDLQQLVNCVLALYRERPAYFLRAPDVFPLYETEWTSFLDNLKKMLQGGETWCLSASAVLFCDTQYVGGPEQALDWITETFNIGFDLDELEFKGDIYNETLMTRQHSVVYLDVSHDGCALGRLVFELYDELLPRTCLNFRQLCSGSQGQSAAGTVLWYAGTPVHRIVRGGWLQAGDIVDGCGGHGESVFGPRLADECFVVPHDQRGRLSMVQDERSGNASQFMVAFQPMTYMQNLCCAFGQLVEGSAVLDQLENVETNNERPMKTVAFTNGGVLYEPGGACRPGFSIEPQEFVLLALVLPLPSDSQDSTPGEAAVASSQETVERKTPEELDSAEKVDILVECHGSSAREVNAGDKVDILVECHGSAKRDD